MLGLVVVIVWLLHLCLISFDELPPNVANDRWKCVYENVFELFIQCIERDRMLLIKLHEQYSQIVIIINISHFTLMMRPFGQFYENYG